jgi:short-subunit dehydrogenase
MKAKVVIITGASSGIGWATAKEFLKQGSQVVLAARSIEFIDKNEIRQYQSNYLLVPTDVSKEIEAKNLIEKTIKAFGKIDVLINNAGVSMRALFQDVELEVMHKLMDVNFWGSVYCTKYAMPYIVEAKGSVVAVSSIAGFKGLPARIGYTASKYALHGFIDVLRNENLKKNVHVLLIAPGFTASNIRSSALLKDGRVQGDSPRKEEKMMSAEKVAEHIYKGVLHRKRQVILTPVGKATVLLNKMFPRFVDKMIYKQLAKEPDSPLKKV